MSSSHALSILEFLTPDSVIVPLVAENKRDAIDALVNRLAEKCNLPDPEEMKRVVWEREVQRSTGIGQGLAIPHGKSQYLKNLIMAIGIVPDGIEFDSIDQKPVKMIALLLSPSEKIADHIQALGRISRLMNDEGFRARAYAAQDSSELYEQIRAACS